ncbi:hypothetical protein [Spirillospora sp. NBC_01491]|uniref:hypothetical protein n=1 Tax=Spirillospora sp. NBC_01491 TaxID=2976007 RepID=UPI002E338AF7|nr:hypothetical protein [Spirillospora sp. NBC_01491]
MTCSACGNEIERGDTYVAITRNCERVGRLGAIKVKAAELVAAYHEDCAPKPDGA